MTTSPVLEDLVLIDSPGVLSGEKQRIGRSYDFTGVIEWFAQRADMIVLVFDANKLDISDEFKRAIEALRGQDDKIRVVLNKADGVNSQQLLRVYGALMWSLGKVINTPEVTRVYVGSFWEHPYKNTEFARLFDAEREDLIRDLHALPRQATVRKVNELVKRARLAKVHAYIISELHAQMPSVFGKKAKQDELIQNLNQTYNLVMQKYGLSVGDFPDIKRFRERLRVCDFSKFPKLNMKLIAAADNALAEDIPKLVKMFPLEQQVATTHTNPFELATPQEQRMAALGISEADARQFSDTFRSFPTQNGRASGSDIKKVMVESRLPKDVLAKIWNMCDRGQHGALNEDEFILVMGLINIALSGKELPESLPATMSSLPPGLQSRPTADAYQAQQRPTRAAPTVSSTPAASAAAATHQDAADQKPVSSGWHVSDDHLPQYDAAEAAAAAQPFQPAGLQIEEGEETPMADPF